MHRSSISLCAYPWKLHIPWKQADPITEQKNFKNKNYEPRIRYTGHPPPTEAAKANLKRPLGRPSVKSRVIDSRLTRSRNAHRDFNIHPFRTFANGLESRDNAVKGQASEYEGTTHFLTIPVTNDGIKNRVATMHEEMLKHGKSLERFFIEPHKLCIEFLPLRLVPNEEFDTAYLIKALTSLVEEKSKNIRTLTARLHGLKTFDDGRVLFAALQANASMTRLYDIQRAVLREMYERRRCCTQHSAADAAQVRAAYERYGCDVRHDSRCWAQIVPQVNHFDHFQPHMRVARANFKPEEFKELSLLFDKVPYPSYVHFVNEFFGDQKVSSFALNAVENNEVSSNVVATAHIGTDVDADTSSAFLRRNIAGGLPLDLIARSAGTRHVFV